MTDNISRIIKQIATLIPDSQQHLLDELLTHIDALSSKSPGNGDATSSTAQPELDPKSGCYRHGNDSAYYCPNCYEQTNSLVGTQRINAKLRVCPQCRSSLKPITK